MKLVWTKVVSIDPKSLVKPVMGDRVTFRHIVSNPESPFNWRGQWGGKVNWHDGDCQTFGLVITDGPREWIDLTTALVFSGNEVNLYPTVPEVRPTKKPMSA